MIGRLLQHIAPNYCCECGTMGAVLCDSCIKNIVSDPFLWCVACAKRPVGVTGVCGECRVPYERAWVAGVHEGALDAAIDSYKFGAKRDGAAALAQVLHETMPALPTDIVLVPIPTARQHVRVRGFDHMRLVARRLARYKQVACDTSLLRRRTNAVQREASAVQRRQQAKAMFYVNGTVDPARVYVVVDDVMTTGSTVRYAAKALRDAGATQVWVAVLARQMLS